MQSAGTIYVDFNEYKGSGEAILFLRKDNKEICDKIIYLKDVTGEHELVADGFHLPLKVMRYITNQNATFC